MPTRPATSPRTSRTTRSRTLTDTLISSTGRRSPGPGASCPRSGGRPGYQVRRYGHGVQAEGESLDQLLAEEEPDDALEELKRDDIEDDDEYADADLEEDEADATMLGTRTWTPPCSSMARHPWACRGGGRGRGRPPGRGGGPGRPPTPRDRRRNCDRGGGGHARLEEDDYVICPRSLARGGPGWAAGWQSSAGSSRIPGLYCQGGGQVEVGARGLHFGFLDGQRDG